MEGTSGLKAWLGLGSNIGDRMTNLRTGCEALEREGIRIVARSHVYETEPQAGAVGQPDFLNACLEVTTDLDPRGLLAAAKRIEVELGRDPNAPRHSPRPLDIDVLIVEARRIDTPDLEVPHPEIEHRRFVLEPLLELDPPERPRLERALAVLERQRVKRDGTL
ncbi:MAG TPA: 2-amino-4-hydroxy-6-hydroxymethyldihydropteridine diphosphokinase [Thermoleophilaceae bacterium]|nr:2-amino-4-hydroxy-6-hydroxymethyldihydropteridine diphosphokinase [Thermoleophilaceae bacterium]